MSGDFKCIPITKRSRALHRADFGCLKGVYAVNITLGCSFSCVYCYARGYELAPPKGTVYLYHNLPLLLQREGRHLPIGTPVIINTSSDCFQPHPDILKTTHDTLAVLLHRGFQVGILTKGIVPEGFKGLFSRYARQIQFTIGVVSLNEDYCRLFEPYAPLGTNRLASAERLKSWGINVRARLDPLIPFFSDTEENIKSLLVGLKECGVQEIVLSYLQLRPRILENFQRELPPQISKLIFSCFPKKQWETTGSKTLSKMIPRSLRLKGYARIQKIAQELGLKTIICRCKNPDLGLRGSCLPTELKTKKHKRFFQKRLFG